MVTAARTQCPRSAPAPPHELEPTKLLSSNTHTSIPNQQNNTRMTWQQKEDFLHSSKPRKNNRNRHQKKPGHHDDKKEAHAEATDGDKNALTQPPPSTNTHLSQDKSTCVAKQKSKEANKTALGKEYIPPHLRNQPSVKDTEAKPGKSGGATVDVSPFSSATTKSTALTKPDLTPNRAAVHKVTPPSAPTTPCEPAEQEKPGAVMTQTIYDIWNNPSARQTGEGKNSASETFDIWNEPPAWPTTIRQKLAAKKAGNQKSRSGAWDIWNNPGTWETPAVKQSGNQKSGNPHGPRRQPYKKHVWPKNKDMKPIPSSDNEDGGVQWKSDSDGDPDYDVKKLLDWNGDWLPPPESWCARRQWDDRHFGEHLEEWLNELDPKCVGAVYYPLDTFNPEEGPCKELAPRYWLEVKVENTNLRDSWKIISISQPKPLDDDPINPSPWWELYEDVVYTEIVEEGGQQSQRRHASSYLNAVPVPEVRLDLTDPENIGPPRYALSATDQIQKLKQEREEKYRRTMAKRNRPTPQPTIPIVPVEDRSLHPRQNIYLRPVQAADVAGILEIYNWYVERTFYVPEFDALTDDQMRQRINAITNANLPYLVAILKKTTPSKPSPGYVNEKLVGWINLDDYCSRMSLYRYTFEMELFVHPGHRSKGIGKCLMDKLLEIVDPGYRVRGGYEYVNNYEYLKAGPARVVKTILVNCHHENGEDTEKEWQGKFLGFCKFHRVGRLSTVGHKNGKVVDVSIYTHHTKEDVNPDVPPAIMT